MDSIGVGWSVVLFSLLVGIVEPDDFERALYHPQLSEFERAIIMSHKRGGTRTSQAINFSPGKLIWHCESCLLPPY